VSEEFAFDFEAPVSEEDAIRNSLRDAISERNKLKASISDAQDEIVKLQAEYRRIKMEAEAQMRKLKDAELDLIDSIRDVKSEIYRKNQEIANLERELALYLQRQAQQKAFKDVAEQMNLKTQTFYWRDWAKSHQLDGAYILAMGNKCILGDKMGLGKTLTSLMTLDMVEAKRVLIVVPADIVRNFEQEARRWSPHRSVVAMYKMNKNERNSLFQLLSMGAPDSEFTIILNYEIWRKDKSVIQQLINLRFDTVIADEAHSMKNASSAAFQGVRDIVMAENVCPKCNGPVADIKLGKYEAITQCMNKDWTNHDTDFSWEIEDRRSVKNVYPMTGTPILNRPQELFPLLNLILPEIFTTERQYLNMYCRQNYDGKWEFAPGGLDKLKHHLQGRYLARDRKAAGVVLPPQEILVHEIDFDAEKYPLQWKYMKQLKQYNQIVLEKSGKSMTALAAITMILRLRQMNVWPAGIQIKDEEGFVVFNIGDEVQESIKVDKVIELIEDAGDDRVVLFSQFKPPLKEIQRRLEKLGISAVIYDGDTPEYIREQVKADFNRSVVGDGPYKWQVVLANYKTGGVGLNFTAATQMIILDEEWNPGKEEQAFARMDRIGQTEETTVHILRVKGTIDTWLAQLIEEKRKVVSGFEREGNDLSQQLLEALNNGEII
jgi:SNF2 family DNA or RNA helicase